MNKAPPLYILRHGETTWNAAGRLQGRFDAPLTPAGIAQARAQRRILLGRDLRGFSAVRSPQGRAFKTARIAVGGLCIDLQTNPALREIGMGEVAGRYRDDLRRDRADQARFDIYELAPGGEGFEALRCRCVKFLRGLSGPTVLITHGVTSRMLRVVLTGRPTAHLPDIGGGQGVVYFVQNGQQVKLTLPR